MPSRVLIATLVAPLLAAPATAADIGPLPFVCDDGTRFTITFHDDAWAVLAIGDHRSTLTQKPMASGIRYEGHALAYQEHQGIGTLIRLPEGKETTCRRQPG